jgi:hypothetical protein
MSIQIPLYTFLPTASLFIAVPALLVVFHLFKRKKEEKRNPLCKNILRGPGESLRVKLIEIDEKINENLIFLFFMPALLVGTSFTQMYFTGKQFNSTAIIVYSVGTISVVIFFAIKFYKLLCEKIAYNLGLDAE